MVEKWETDEDENAVDVANTSMGSAMDVDEQPNGQEITDSTEGHEDSGDEEEDTSDVAMVPMADMLNARYQAENVSISHSQYNCRSY